MKDVCALTSLDKERQCLPLKKMRVCLHSCETEILSICEAGGVTGLLLCIKDSDSLNSGFSTFWRPESHSQIPYSLFISYHLPPWGVTISCNMSSNQEEGRGRDQPPSAVEKAGSLPVVFSLLCVSYLLQKSLHLLAPSLPLWSSPLELF